MFLSCLVAGLPGFWVVGKLFFGVCWVGGLFARFLACCVVVLLGCWLLGCWVAGFLGSWVIGLSFGCWLVGFLDCSGVEILFCKFLSGSMSVPSAPSSRKLQSTLVSAERQPAGVTQRRAAQ